MLYERQVDDKVRLLPKIFVAVLSAERKLLAATESVCDGNKEVLQRQNYSIVEAVDPRQDAVKVSIIVMVQRGRLLRVPRLGK